MAKTNKYWQDRFTAMDDTMYKKSEAFLNNLQKQFKKANLQIEKDMSYWYQKLADNNEISYDEALKFLDADEVADFHMEVAEYIAHGRARGLDSTWERQMVNASSKVHISRLREIQTELANTVHNLYADYNESLTGYLSTMIPDSYYRTAYEIAKGTGVAVSLHALDTARVNKMLTTPWCSDKKAFSGRIWARRDDLINTLNTQLTQMLITGKSPDAMIKKLAHDFNVEKSAAGRLVMTESAAFANEARRQCMKDLDIEEFQFVATLDSHTSELCRNMDGQHFPMSKFEIGVNAPPLHCNCRSCTVPYFDDEFTQDETRAAREPGDEGYKQVPSNMTYKEWEKKYISANKQNNLKKSSKDSKISSPINARTAGHGSAASISLFGGRLNNRQNSILNLLQNYDDSIVVRKKDVSMSDLAALTAKENVEFAMFTKGSERLIIRGDSESVNITPEKAQELANKGYKFSGHTHPGSGRYVLTASDGDYEVLKAFNQKQSVIYNSDGSFTIFEVE